MDADAVRGLLETHAETLVHVSLAHNPALVAESIIGVLAKCALLTSVSLEACGIEKEQCDALGQLLGSRAYVSVNLAKNTAVSCDAISKLVAKSALTLKSLNVNGLDELDKDAVLAIAAQCKILESAEDSVLPLC
jgi:hypothetical protein